MEIVNKLIFGRARWGGSGALYLQSAIAGLNSYNRLASVGSALCKWQWKLGPAQWKSMNPVRFGRKQR